MAETFDPDKYLAEKTAPTAQVAQGFDPDKYLAEKTGATTENKAPWYRIENPTGREFTKKALGYLPMAGMATGGILGAPAGPATAVAGAGAGSLAGTALKQAGEGLLLGEEPLTGEKIQELGLAPTEGMLGEAGGQLATKGLMKAGELATKIPGVKKGLEYVGQKAISGAGKIGELFTGVPEKEVQTYMKRGDVINQMAKSSNHDEALAADELRSQWFKDIMDKKKELNTSISQALKDQGSKEIQSKPILDALESGKSKINPKLNPEQISFIDETIGKIKSLETSEGKLNIKDANDIKSFLQEEAKATYGQNGQIFTKGDSYAKAAKQGAREARGLLNKEVPEIAKANETLSEFHDIEDNMNRNLLAEGKPHSAIIAAGSGANPRNAANLEELGRLTGKNYVEDAENLAAMKTFGKPKLMPQEHGGTVRGRTALASGLGYLAGGAPGAVASGILTSPASLKAGIDIGRGLLEAASNPDTMKLLLSPMSKEQADRILQQSK